MAGGGDSHASYPKGALPSSGTALKYQRTKPELSLVDLQVSGRQLEVGGLIPSTGGETQR